MTPLILVKRTVRVSAPLIPLSGLSRVITSTLTYLLTYNTYLVAEAAAAPLNTSDLLRVVFIICVDIMRLLSCTRVYMNHAVVWPEGATTLHDSLSHSLRHPEFLPPSNRPTDVTTPLATPNCCS